jgi:2-phospho-L-lactate guanylyltransferase
VASTASTSAVIAGVYLVADGHIADLISAQVRSTYQRIGLLPDNGGGLNAALAHAAAALAHLHPDDGVATIVADLPALRPSELLEVLMHATSVERAFVPDFAGIGTTVLTVAAGHALAPYFGADSAVRHRASGARQLLAGSSVRSDVDTATDLARCLALGVGRRTSAVIARRK